MQVRIFQSTTPARSEAERGVAVSVPFDERSKPPVSSISISSASTASSSAGASLSIAANSNSNKSRVSISSYEHVKNKGMAERLSKAGNKSTKKNRAEELAPLREKFQTFCKQFKPFIDALKSYHSSVVQLENNRLEVSRICSVYVICALFIQTSRLYFNVEVLLSSFFYCLRKVLNRIEVLTADTPLQDTAGKVSPIVAAAPQSWAKTVAKREKTYCALGQQMNALNVKYAQNIEEHCIEYVQEWEMIVTTRIMSSLSKADGLKKTVKHYEEKVVQLQIQKQANKGKPLDKKTKEKLVRNQEKLAVAKEEYENCATTVCHMIDSALDYAWRDMTPMIYQLFNMEHDRVGGKDSQEIVKSLSTLVSSLKSFAKEHKIAL